MSRMTPTCWDILSLSEARRNHVMGVSVMTERDIKKAYRTIARMTHPDKYHKPQDKDKATEIFRKVYQAYEQALELLHSPNPQRERRGDRTQREDSSASDHYMQAAFEAVCRELDEEFMDQWQQSIQQTAHLIKEAWPDQNRAFEILRTSRPFLSDLRPWLDPDIYVCLDQRRRARLRTSCATNLARQHHLLRFINENRNRDAAWLYTELSQRWLLLDVTDAIKTCDDPCIKGILQWYHTERSKRSEDLLTQQLQETARGIQDVHPDIPAMKQLLRPITYRAHRKRVLEYLPREMRYLAGVLLVEGTHKRVKLR